MSAEKTFPNECRYRPTGAALARAFQQHKARTRAWRSHLRYRHGNPIAFWRGWPRSYRMERQYEVQDSLRSRALAARCFVGAEFEAESWREDGCSLSALLLGNCNTHAAGVIGCSSSWQTRRSRHGSTRCGSRTCARRQIALRCHFTNGQLLSASGLNASAAGMVARTL